MTQHSASIVGSSGATLGRRLAERCVDPDARLGPEVQRRLILSLYGPLALVAFGALNGAALAAMLAARFAQTPFLLWAFAELAIAGAQAAVWHAGRGAREQKEVGPIAAQLLLACAQAASLGFGALITVSTGDPAAIALVCLAAAPIAGTWAIRYAAAPRLAAGLALVALAPLGLAAAFAGAPFLLLLPIEAVTGIAAAAFVAAQARSWLIATLAAEHEREKRATHDLLTGVLNRSGLVEEAGERIARGEPFALFHLDIDRFKAVNDTFGHQIGDELLKAVAERLELVARPDAAIARAGGDEFVILCAETDARAVADFGELVVGAVADGSYRLGAETVEIGASVGVALFPQHGADLGTLLGESDTALYRAKFWGRSHCVVIGAQGEQEFAKPGPSRLERSAA